MTQAASVAPTSLHACAMRVTRLAASGAAVSGTTAGYVSRRLVELGYTIDATNGEVREITGGCNQTLFRLREPDRFNGFTFNLDVSSIEPKMFELMTGMALLLDTSTVPVPRGLNFPDTQAVNPPDVALEVWTEAYEVDEREPSPFRYIRWIFPKTRWRIDDGALNVEAKTESLTGYSQPNSGWGSGPYADQGGPIGENGGIIFVDTLPAATTPDYLTVP